MKPINNLSILLLLCAITFLITSCEDEDPCQDIICFNEGTCIDGACECPVGFSGETCEIEDLCITQAIECQNGGECVDGICDCPTGFVGTNCELIDTAIIQDLLDNGFTPKTLYDGGVTLKQLYGKMYLNGLIFYLNTDDGTGMVASKEDQSDGAEWGCFGIDLEGLINAEWNNGLPAGPGADIGDGKSNTEIIVNANCITIEGGEPAANLCRNLGEEWFLPSINELTLMYTNLHVTGHGNFALDTYWSSSENSVIHGWITYFINGGEHIDIKENSKYHVRAAREF